jgi:hypothetical protein
MSTCVGIPNKDGRCFSNVGLQFLLIIPEFINELKNLKTKYGNWFLEAYDKMKKNQIYNSFWDSCPKDVDAKRFFSPLSETEDKESTYFKLGHRGSSVLNYLDGVIETLQNHGYGFNFLNYAGFSHSIDMENVGVDELITKNKLEIKKNIKLDDFEISQIISTKYCVFSFTSPVEFLKDDDKLKYSKEYKHNNLKNMPLFSKGLSKIGYEILLYGIRSSTLKKGNISYHIYCICKNIKGELCIINNEHVKDLKIRDIDRYLAGKLDDSYYDEEDDKTKRYVSFILCKKLEEPKITILYTDFTENIANNFVFFMYKNDYDVNSDIDENQFFIGDMISITILNEKKENALRIIFDYDDLPISNKILLGNNVIIESLPNGNDVMVKLYKWKRSESVKSYLFERVLKFFEKSKKFIPKKSFTKIYTWEYANGKLISFYMDYSFFTFNINGQYYLLTMDLIFYNSEFRREDIVDFIENEINIFDKVNKLKIENLLMDLGDEIPEEISKESRNEINKKMIIDLIRSFYNPLNQITKIK